MDPDYNGLLKYVISRVDTDYTRIIRIIKSETGWKIASFHSSMNAFENAIIDQIKNTYVWVAVGMLIAGLAFGAFFMRLSMRR